MDDAIEPTFETPEDAVADALVKAASVAALPGSLDVGERVERSEGAVDPEFRESDDNHVVWSTAQDEGGQWGLMGGQRLPARQLIDDRGGGGARWQRLR